MAAHVLISRRDFRHILKHAIRSSGLTWRERRRLRKVLNATEVAVGMWETEGVGCPLVQAGLISNKGGYVPQRQKIYDQFTAQYDGAVNDWVVIDKGLQEEAVTLLTITDA